MNSDNSPGDHLLVHRGQLLNYPVGRYELITKLQICLFPITVWGMLPASCETFTDKTGYSTSCHKF